MAETEAADDKKGIPGVDFIPDSEKQLPSRKSLTIVEEELRGEVDELKKQLEAKDASIAELESQVRVGKYTIQQMEEEMKSMAAKSSSGSGRGTKLKRKKKKKKGKKKKGKKKAHNNAGEESDGEEYEEEGDITYEGIARAYPNITLEAVLAAERQFMDADDDGDGTIDTKELDQFLSKHGAVFSQSQLEGILKSVDIDGDDRIDFMEYLSIIDALKNPEKMKNKRTQMSPTTSAAFANIQRQYSKACSIQ